MQYFAVIAEETSLIENDLVFTVRQQCGLESLEVNLLKGTSSTRHKRDSKFVLITLNARTIILLLIYDTMFDSFDNL